MLLTSAMMKEMDIDRFKNRGGGKQYKKAGGLLFDNFVGKSCGRICGIRRLLYDIGINRALLYRICAKCDAMTVKNEKGGEK